MIGIVDAGVGGFGSGIDNGIVGPIAPTIRQYLCSDFDPIGGSSAFRKFTVSSLVLASNYIVCVPVGGGSSVNVAIPDDMWPTLHASDEVPGVGTVTYDYSYLGEVDGSGYPNPYRTAILPDSYEEIQLPTPPYIMSGHAGQTIITAFQMDTGLSGVGWQEQSGREWAWDPFFSP